MLKLGKSKVWTEAFKSMTGYTNLTAEPIKGYFKVLYDWMKEQRQIHKYPIGWSSSPASSPSPSKEPSTPKPGAAPSHGTNGLLFCFALALGFLIKR